MLLSEIQYELSRRNLADFVRNSWHVVEPGTPLVWGWYMDAICEHLEALYRGDIRNLLINIPPRHLKSGLGSVGFPAWIWLQDPHEKILGASYSMDLARRDCRKSRQLIESEWYQQIKLYCGYDWELSEDQNTKALYVNTVNGHRQAISVGGGTTGFGGNIRILDDPLNASDRYSDTKIAEHIDWIDSTWSTRKDDPEKARNLVIMQRLCERDATAHLLSKGNYELLCLPTEFNTQKRCSTSIGWSDPRETDGDLLFPERFTAEEVASLKNDLGIEFEGQHNQCPAPPSGNLFQLTQIKFWYKKDTLPSPHESHIENGETHRHEQVELPEKIDNGLQSWDMTFKAKTSSDYVAGQAWMQSGPDAFLIDQIHSKLSFTDTCEAVKTLSSRNPWAQEIIVEDKANGPAVMDTLRNEVAALVAIEPEGGKIARAHAVTKYFRGGNVYLPHPSQCSWVLPLISELLKFPNDKYDDQVDALTQAINHLYNHGFSFYIG